MIIRNAKWASICIRFSLIGIAAFHISLTNSWASSSTNEAGFYRVRAAPRGTFVTNTLLHSFSTLAIQAWLNSLNITSVVAAHAVSVYRVSYETFDHRGLSTLASGAVAVPDDGTNMPLIAAS